LIYSKSKSNKKGAVFQSLFCLKKIHRNLRKSQKPKLPFFAFAGANIGKSFQLSKPKTY
jgi:hypothetical protein